MTTIHPPLGAAGITAHEALDAEVLAGATVYLEVAGPTRLGDLARILAQYLETSYLQLVTSSIMTLVSEGHLTYNASGLVSLPAGSAPRDNEEQR
jgi:hypothetical protein